jgi:hypothetical protein
LQNRARPGARFWPLRAAVFDKLQEKSKIRAKKKKKSGKEKEKN